MFRLFRSLPILLATLTWPVSAHEYWIEPDNHAVAPDDSVTGVMRVGQDFSGPIFPYISDRFRSFTIHDAAGDRPVTALEGDDISLSLSAAPGLTIVTYHSTADTATFDTVADFSDYLAYEGLGHLVGAHRAAGLPEDGFSEDYVRCAKTLIQAGPVSPADQDRATGLPAELIALDNPQTPGLSELRVRMLWQGAPVKGLQVAVFHRPGQGEPATRTLYQTGDDGVASIDVGKRGRYLLNAVHMKRTGRERGTVWKSHWASLTFAVP